LPCRRRRNYEDVTDTARELIRPGVRIETVINRMTFDGTMTDPMQQAIPRTSKLLKR
jgi:putative DNA-invertase from lambdoid prophage Rac